MNTSLTRDSVLETKCDLLVLWMQKDAKEPQRPFSEVDAILGGQLTQLLTEDRMKGLFGEKILLSSFGKIKAKKVAVIGLGDKSSGVDVLRKSGGYAAKLAHEFKAKYVALALPSSGSDAESSSCAFAEGFRLAAYAFEEHFGTGRTAKKEKIEEAMIVGVERSSVKAVERGLERARVLAEATDAARHLVNLSPRHMRPMDLAEAAQALVARGNGISCKMYNREQMEHMGMGAALAVGEGSVHQPVCVHLIYKPKKKKSKRIVAVIGKGVTFDSGGLSLKPADAMVNMKIDMGGAASVIGLFHALPQLNIPVEVHGVFIGVENMPSGHAYRPGDVVKAMNGMTIEIQNTDAEGRVVLADALSYTVKKIKPDVMIDLATLTGATIIALGDDCTSVMSNDRNLAKELLRAAKVSGELMWELPLIAHYDDALKSHVADVNNTGGRAAGAIKGGLFLKRFVAGMPWAHLDIGGSVFCEKEYRPDIPYGATGVGVRTLIAYLEQKL